MQTRSLSSLFQAVVDELETNRLALNQADPFNANHGDHMLQVFRLAVLAANQAGEGSLPEDMLSAAQQLESIEGNGTALIYGRGLRSLAEQFQQRQISLEDLLWYVQAHLSAGDAPPSGELDPDKSAQLLKALLNGLVGWQQNESGEPRALDMSFLFSLGISYLQAKQQNKDRLDALAETLINACPLGRVEHRRHSGRLALRALLQSMQRMAEQPSNG